MLKLKLQYFGHLSEELTHWKRPWCLEGLGAGGEGDDRGWDGWMASPTRWTCVWVNSRSLWWTGRPGVLRFVRSQRVRHDWATELNWLISIKCTTKWLNYIHACIFFSDIFLYASAIFIYKKNLEAKLPNKYHWDRDSQLWIEIGWQSCSGQNLLMERFTLTNTINNFLGLFYCYVNKVT